MITSDLLRNVPLFAGVPDAELGTIASRAADVQLRANDWLIQEGEVPSFFILLSGRITVSKQVGGRETIPAKYNEQTTLGHEVVPEGSGRGSMLTIRLRLKSGG